MKEKISREFLVVKDLLHNLTVKEIQKQYGLRGIRRINETGYLFANLVKYIRSCPAYQEGYAKINITENKITFGISLREIEASFPEVKNLLGNPRKRFSEENIKASNGSETLSYLKTTFPFSIKEQQDKLLIEAKEYFHSLKTKSKQNFAQLKKPVPPNLALGYPG